MRISVIGTGYVGLVTGVCLAQLGHAVTCCDVIKEKIGLISAGTSPIFEPKLEGLLKKNLSSGRLKATTDIPSAVSNSEMSFICVGTPSREDGSIDLTYIQSAAESVSKSMKDGHVVTVKSTVVPGTTQSLIPILEKSGHSFGLCMNPEFLKEGSAVDDFMNPDRIVLGGRDDASRKALAKVYAPFSCPKLEVDLSTAEMIKYAANAFLATKISFINEIANMCERGGIDVTKVAEGIGLDSRIGPKFLKAGCGFGGSCFPKDVKALVSWSKSRSYVPLVIESVLEVNKKQPLMLVDMAQKSLASLKGKTVSVLGLSFKPDTDDIREAPSLSIIQKLLDSGSKVVVYDPQSMENVKRIYADRIYYAKTPQECLEGSDAALIVTEWKEVRALQPVDFKAMKRPLIIDGRRALNPDLFIKAGIEYHGIGWGR